jgi:glycolate oxidase iron-sulfur subunit
MTQALELLYDVVAQCNRCGFCQTACPVFRATGHEIGVARGRLSLVRGLIEKRLEWTEELKDPLFACLLCDACTAHCFPRVPTSEILVAARAEYLEHIGQSRMARALLNHLLPYPDRLRKAARAVALGQKSPLSALAQALGLLRIFGRDFPRAQAISGQLPTRALREQSSTWTLDGAGDGPDIGYFAGCGMDLIFPDTARASVHSLVGRSRSVTVLNNACCGLPAQTYGDREAARRLARANIEALDGHELIVTDCSSCASFLKKYPSLFDPEEPEHARAAGLAGRVRDLLEMLPPPQGLFPAEAGPIPVTYHHPCHAVRGQNLASQPLDCLRSHPGFEVREMKEADWCCGGAGAYALFHYDLAMEVLKRKMDNILDTGAELVFTSCPACVMQLSYGARLHQIPVRVMHISECLGQASEERPPQPCGQLP